MGMRSVNIERDVGVNGGPKKCSYGLFSPWDQVCEDEGLNCERKKERTC